MVPYKPGNRSDRIKHFNLEMLVRLAKPNKYFELHSGEGRYVSVGGDTFSQSVEIYNGSSILALNIMALNGPYRAFLHEINEESRKKLMQNVSQFRDVIVGEDWKEHIDEHIEMADENSLFMIDPNTCDEYEPIILNHLDKMLEKKPHIFMYVPHVIGNKKHEEILGELRAKIEASLIHSSRYGQDLEKLIGIKRQYTHYGHDAHGRKPRKDHNIIISSPSICSEFEKQNSRTTVAILKSESDYFD